MKTAIRRTSAAWLLAGLLLPWAVPPPPARALSAPRALGKPTSDDGGDRKDSTVPPFKGMTAAQARRAYGKPDSVGHRDGTELWTYVLNRGENLAKFYIPFNFNNPLRYRLLTFKDGKVVDFRWDAPDKKP